MSKNALALALALPLLCCQQPEGEAKKKPPAPLSDWKEIDKLHANPPRTTRELLHPDEYWARVARGEKGMPPFKGVLDESKIETLATFIKEELKLKE